MGQLDLFGDTAPEPSQEGLPEHSGKDVRRGIGRRKASVPIAPAEVDARLQALAGRLDARIRLGTSSWAFPGWSGLVYRDTQTQQRLSREGLSAYSQHPLISTVAIDSGFYAPLNAQRLAAYAAQVPDDFRFLVKAPALITDRHQRTAGGRPNGLNPAFLDAELAIEQAVEPYLEGLGARAGLLLFQFPPQGRPANLHPRQFAEALYRFLRRLPSGPTYAVEVRDPELLTSDFAAALAHGGAIPGLAVHPRLPDLATQAERYFGEAARQSAPADSLMHQGGPLLIRWLLRPDLGYEAARERYAPFDTLLEPDPETRRCITQLIRSALTEERTVYMIANNKAEGSSPLTLRALASALVE